MWGKPKPVGDRLDTQGAKGWVRWPSGFCLAQINGCWEAVMGVAENLLLYMLVKLKSYSCFFLTLCCHFGLWLVTEAGKEPGRKGLLTPGRQC